MPDLVIGRTAIPYRVRRSQKARRKRIIVTPQAVEVVVPDDCPEHGPGSAASFMDTKRAWVWGAVQDCQQHAMEVVPARYQSGSKVPFRGRNLMLEVQADPSANAVQVACRSKFVVRHPATLQGQKRDSAIAAAMDCWLRERCLDDANRFARRHAKRLRAEPAGVRLSDSRHYWGTCGKDQVVRIHADLIQAPAAVLEYVVAHEVTHLIERNHSERFWKLISSTLPDWQQRKQLLESWERHGERRRHREV